MSKYGVRCPTGCSGSERSDKIDPEKLIEAGVTGDWLSDAMMCGYCGCVYSNDQDHEGHIYKRTQRGYFTAELIEPGRWNAVDLRTVRVEYLD